MTSEIFQVRNVPVPEFKDTNHHPGVDALLTVMGKEGSKFYKSPQETATSGPGGIIDRDDLVVIKVNGQWKHRGMTNIDVIRGLIQSILDHPDDFTGEVVIFENGQGRGSIDCDMCDAWYTTGESAANAENPSHTWRWLMENVYNMDDRVSMILFDPYYKERVEEDDHEGQGFRFFNPHPERHTWELTYPVFNTQGGRRVDFRRGVWTGDGYDDSKLKLISVPVMKNHRSAGVTCSLKLYFGVLSVNWNSSEYHDNIGLTCAEMFVHIRAPDLIILDAIWMPVNAVNGHPDTLPQRTNQLLAATDPLALDYYGSKRILFPLSRNPLHNPDEPLKFRMKTLLPAWQEFHQCGGVRGNPVTMNEGEMKIHRVDL